MAGGVWGKVYRYWDQRGGNGAVGAAQYGAGEQDNGGCTENWTTQRAGLQIVGKESVIRTQQQGARRRGQNECRLARPWVGKYQPRHPAVPGVIDRVKACKTIACCAAAALRRNHDHFIRILRVQLLYRACAELRRIQRVPCIFRYRGRRAARQMLPGSPAIMGAVDSLCSVGRGGVTILGSKATS